MNKAVKTILIISAIIFGTGFLFVNSTQATDNKVWFGDKNISIDFNGLPFDLNNWAPGMSVGPKTIRITNNENFDINVYLSALTSEPSSSEGEANLADVLTVTIGDKSVHLSDLFNDNISLAPVDSGKSQNYNIALSFDEAAGNKYQGKTINFDFIITAEEIGKGGKKIPVVIIPGGGTTYIPPTPAIPTTETGEVMVTPGEGGIVTLTNSDGSKIKLAVPAGAVPANTNFTIERVDISSVSQPDPASGLFLIAGLVYEIKAQRDGELITTFDKPVTLTFAYTDEQIKRLDENSLKIYWRNGEEWVALENSEVDIENNTVIASVSHLTLFALIGPKIGFVGEREEGKKPFEIVKKIPEKITEEVKKITGRIIPLAPTAEGRKPSEIKSEMKKNISPKETISTVETPKKGLASMLADIGMAWKGINESAFLTIIVILCLMGLVLIGIREWRLFRRKKRNSE